MYRQQYWKWIETIWQNPTQAVVRMNFADWLMEEGCQKAGQKQREFAKIVDNTIFMYSIELSQTSFNSNKYWYTTKIFGFVKRNNDLCQFYELKRDGKIVFHSKNQGHDGLIKHALIGHPKSLPETKQQRKNRSKRNRKEQNYQALKNAQFALFYESKSGRFPGTGKPNESAMPKSDSSSGNSLGEPGFSKIQEEDRLNKNPCVEVAIDYDIKEEEILANLKNKEKILEDCLKETKTFCKPVGSWVHDVSTGWLKDMPKALAKSGIFHAADFQSFQIKAPPFALYSEESKKPIIGIGTQGLQEHWAKVVDKLLADQEKEALMISFDEIRAKGDKITIMENKTNGKKE